MTNVSAHHGCYQSSLLNLMCIGKPPTSSKHDENKVAASMSHDKVATRRRSESNEGAEQAAGPGSKPKRQSTSLIGAVGCPAPGTPPAPVRTSKPRSPSASSSCEDGGTDSPSRVIKVPDVAIPMQHGLLKRISAFQSKEDLLEFVSHYHCLLDLINLVTCLYRLAKMSKEASRARSSYLAELQKHPTFQLLLRSISSKLLQAHLNYLHTHSEGIKGVDGRCLANLTWALAKLDLSSDDSALTTELALMVAPFIIRTLDTSSPQGLANMLWSYAKLPVAPPAVVFALVHKITDQLVLQSQRPDGASTFDAQALSNSIWALAHLKSRGMEVDALRHPDLMRFLNELARAAARALVRPHHTLAPPGSNGVEPRLPECQRYLALVEREFSCQALVNIAWSFATLLGVACCQQQPIQQLFVLIHSESLVRLRCTALVLDNGQSLPYVGGGGFNEQALSNAVYAFDKVGLLSGELLGAVFEVSALRLRRGSMAHHTEIATFKPQELCTLLKACHSNIAPPWVFLGSLLRLLSAHPAMADSWTTAERLELHKACQLYILHQAEAARASALASRQGVAGTIDVNQAVSAAQGLVNSIANSISAAGSLAAGGGGNNTAAVGSVGRMSSLGSSPPVYGERRQSGGAASSFGGRARSSSGTGLGFSTTGQGLGETDVATSTFGQLPVSQPGNLPTTGLQLYEQLIRRQQSASALDANNSASNNFALLQQLQQQQQQAQQQQAAVAALFGSGLGGPLMTCPVCSSSLRQEEALSHVEACLANLEAASGLEAMIRQQQQQEAAMRWAAQQQQQQQAAQNQQQQNLLVARLQQLQQQQAQQNLLAAAAAAAGQQQAQQLQSGLLRLDDFVRMNGAPDPAQFSAWMLDGNMPAASRPPLRPIRRQ